MKDLNERGLENQVKGTAKEVKGQVRGDLGDATDNTSEHIKGRAEELEGKIQKNFGKAEKKTDDAVWGFLLRTGDGPLVSGARFSGRQLR